MSEEILKELRALRTEMRALGQRVERLETLYRELKPPIPEEDLAILSAAVAAYFGKRTPIRQVRLISSKSWAMQGRASIQASHQPLHERRHPSS